MITLAPNTVSKLNYFDNRIKSYYEKHGNICVPLDGTRVQKMIDQAQNELRELFYKIWGSSMGYHLLDKFYGFRGNVFEFFMSLDAQNRERFTSINW